MAADHQNEPGAVEPIPGRPLVAAEQVGGGPAEGEGATCPASFDEPPDVTLDLRPAAGRYPVDTVSPEDGPDAVEHLGRQVLVVCDGSWSVIVRRQ